MFSIAICDDEELFCSQLERYLEPLQKKEQVRVDIYYRGEELYRQMCGGRFFDLIFLDIKLRTMNGVTLAEKIRNDMQNEKTHIVFISGQKEYAMELFAVRPLHFLIKPVGEEDVISVVKKGMEISSVYSRYLSIGREIPSIANLMMRSCTLKAPEEKQASKRRMEE